MRFGTCIIRHTHSLAPSLTHSLTHSLPHSLTHSLALSLCLSISQCTRFNLCCIHTKQLDKYQYIKHAIVIVLYERHPIVLLLLVCLSRLLVQPLVDRLDIGFVRQHARSTNSRAATASIDCLEYGRQQLVGRYATIGWCNAHDISTTCIDLYGWRRRRCCCCCCSRTCRCVMITLCRVSVVNLASKIEQQFVCTATGVVVGTTEGLWWWHFDSEQLNIDR
jgi:hypothetical protein